MKLITFNAITKHSRGTIIQKSYQPLFSTYNKTTIYDIFIVKDICARYNLN